ncbi:ABC transporter substrate-binding protein [Kyrpidia spormannii]|uniref:ABC transporter substrate-binding protein n=1 Tax=Kyrpidia spormannii TaxID=2055160 RepID=A0ACA8Z9T3_9BACL|nr:ABC transporter substrate-binding protein [Kyrpidia spormannii]CAB3392372.1 ABC transporter substrate-binding protein [Kyrpidia spormannii]
MIKKFRMIIPTLALALGLVGCGGSPASSGGGQGASPGGGAPSDTIKIGAELSVTGPASSLGRPERDTLQMVVDEINASGGVGGKKLQLITYDDESNPTKAVLNLKKLLDQDHVSAVIGGTTSAISLGLIPTIEQAQVPFFSLAADQRIATPVKPWVFKLPQGDNLVVERILAYLKSQNITKVGWLSSSDDFGQGGKNTFEALAPKFGIQGVAFESYVPTDKDMIPQLTRIKNANPQAVIIYGIPPGASIATKNFAQLGFKVPLIHSHGIANQDFLTQTGSASNGVVFPASKLLVANQLPDTDKQKAVLLKYKDDFEKKFGYPANAFGGHAWDAIHIVAKAVGAVGGDHQKIRDYVENNTKDFVGCTGVFTFNPADHNGLTKEALALIKVVDGKWTLLQE